MKKVFRKLLLLLPVAACCFLCSCATALTVENMGREAFRWDPRDMQVSVHTKTDKNFMEHKVVHITKPGRLKSYWLPYDFARKFPSDDKVSRTVEFPVKGTLPAFSVKLDKSAKPQMIRHRNGQISTNDSKLAYSFPGFVESVRPCKVSEADFQLLQKPFWYCQRRNEWFFCVPMPPIKMGDYYHIPVMLLHPGGERYLSPDEIREEELYWNGFGINCARVVCSIVPLAFDIATFPVQLIVFTLL